MGKARQRIRQRQAQRTSTVSRNISRQRSIARTGGTPTESGVTTVTRLTETGTTVTVTTGGLVTERDAEGNLVQQTTISPERASAFVEREGGNIEQALAEARAAQQQQQQQQEIQAEQQKARSTISAAQPFERKGITSFQQFQELQAREEAPIREGKILQPLEKAQRKLEEKARGTGALSPFTTFAAGTLAAPVGLLRAGLRPIQTIKGVGTAIKDPFGTGAAIGAELQTRPEAFLGEVGGLILTTKGISKGIKAAKIKSKVKTLGAAETEQRLGVAKVTELTRAEEAIKIGKQKFRVSSRTGIVKFKDVPKKGATQFGGVADVKIAKATKGLEPIGKPSAFQFGIKGIEVKGKTGAKFFLTKQTKTGKFVTLEKGKLISATKQLEGGAIKTGTVEFFQKPKGKLPRVGRFKTVPLEGIKEVATITSDPFGRPLTIIRPVAETTKFFKTTGIRATFPIKGLKGLGIKGQQVLAPLKTEQLFRPSTVSTAPQLAVQSATSEFLSVVLPEKAGVATTLSAAAFLSQRQRPFTTTAAARRQAAGVGKLQFPVLDPVSITDLIPKSRQSGRGRTTTRPVTDISITRGVGAALPSTPFLLPPTSLIPPPQSLRIIRKGKKLKRETSISFKETFKPSQLGLELFKVKGITAPKPEKVTGVGLRLVPKGAKIKAFKGLI